MRSVSAVKSCSYAFEWVGWTRVLQVMPKYRTLAYRLCLPNNSDAGVGG